LLTSRPEASDPDQVKADDVYDAGLGWRYLVLVLTLIIQLKIKKNNPDNISKIFSKNIAPLTFLGAVNFRSKHKQLDQDGHVSRACLFASPWTLPCGLRTKLPEIPALP